MSWRDEPEIIWRDEVGDQMVYRNGALAVTRLADGKGLIVVGPGTPGGWDELFHRLAAVAGRRITGIEDAPRPIEVGDIVQWEGVVGTYEVRHVDGEQAMVRYPKTGQSYVARMVQLRHVEAETSEPELEPEVQWIEKGETPDDVWAEMITAALDDGRRVEYYAGGEWVPPSGGARVFGWFGRFSEVRYRIEAPNSLDRVVWECTADHRLCAVASDARCRGWGLNSGLVCSRPRGHDMPHVACNPSASNHNLASWSGDL